MTIRNGWTAAWMVLAAVAAFGQQGQVAGPVTGYVFDSSARAVRPVLGVPGASLLGAPLSFGYDVASVTISPRGDTAVAIAADGTPHLVALGAGGPAEIPLNGLAAKPERVIFSPSGMAVALAGGVRVQVVAGLGGSPSLAGVVQLSAAAGNHGQAEDAKAGAAMGAGPMALSDDGGWLLEPSQGVIRLIGVQGGSNTLVNASRGSLGAFAPGSHDVAVMDPGVATLVLIEDATGAAGRRVLSQDAALAHTLGLAFSTDGKSLFLASSAGVTVFDVASGGRSAVGCDCAPTGLDRMGSVYRLNQPGAWPLWLLDQGSSPMRILFVPATTE